MPTGACCIEQRLDGKSRMSGDVHVRFRERLGVRFPRATRLFRSWWHFEIRIFDLLRVGRGEPIDETME